MPQVQVTMDVRKVGDRVSVVDICGDFTAGAEPALMDACAEASTGDTRAIILNFGGLEYMNSSGIGLLVTLLIRANRRGQKLLAVGLSDHYKRIFELTRLDEAIRKLLPTHMQLIMGIGSAEEIALAEVKAQEQLSRTKVVGNDLDPEPIDSSVEVKCPVTGRIGSRARTAADPIVWTHEAWARLQLVPLIARPLARNTVERFSRAHEIWRITTRVMDENKQAMIEADEFDMDTMLVMFNELRAKQIRAEAEGAAPALSPEMRQMIEEAKAAGITRCPIRDVETKAAKCPVDLKLVKPEDAKAAVEELVRRGG